MFEATLACGVVFFMHIYVHELIREYSICVWEDYFTHLYRERLYRTCTALKI